MIDQEQVAAELINFIFDAPTPGYFVSHASTIFKEHDFIELDLSKPWEQLSPGKNYFLHKDNSAFFAFTVPQNGYERGFRIVGTHIDSPGIKVKPDPVMISEGYLQLNTEVYGGPILPTWFDRPLSVAGTVYSKGEDIFRPTCSLVNLKKPVAVIPSLAIHMNRDVNKNFKIDRQEHLLPVLQTADGDDLSTSGRLLTKLAEQVGLQKQDIIDFDLFLYDAQKGSVFGVENEFISSARLDDQEAAFAGIQALSNARKAQSINVLACFDNEEIGSSTKQGADSELLSKILERIVLGLNGTREDFLVSLENSFLISADGAHSVHPNYSEKSDKTNRPVINGGPVVKISANQKYTTDVETLAVLKEIAKGADVPLQYFVNHSNEPGGSTLGPLSSRHLDIRAVDLGVAMLGMHSIRETIGIKDHIYLQQLLQAFYQV